MQLVPSHDNGAHQHHHDHAAMDKHAGHSTNIFRTKFWVSFALSLPIVAWSAIAQKTLSYSIAFPGQTLLTVVFASVIFWYGGWIFIASAGRELKAKLPGMMTLIGLAISVAYGYSLAVSVFGGGEALWWELSTLITVMLLGHWMEMRAVTGAQGALNELSKLLPDTAEVIRGDTTHVVPLSELKVGDRVLVKPGGRIPADGKVPAGNSDVNESVVTGESNPIAKRAGDHVIAGTINGDGSLTIMITQLGDQTFLAGVMRLVAEAQASKSRLQTLSDRAALWLTIIAIAGGGITLVTWLFYADASFAINRMVAVLVITCPHALGLAIPLVASISTSKAARNGFLVKQRLALEAARTITVVLFDKTGTLTKGEFGVDTIVSNGEPEATVLQYAASVNAKSEHPLAQAMVTAAKQRQIELLPISEFQRLPGKGVRAKVNNTVIQVGSLTLAKEVGDALPEAMQTSADKLAGQGKTINVVIREGHVLGALALVDSIRDESRQAITALKQLGIQTAMITGDSEAVAKWVAGELGIDRYFAHVLPDQKSAKVKELQAEGNNVAMVGDGVNDAPALTQADVGIAIGAGTNVAIESASIVLVKNDPRDITKIIRLSKLTYTKMIQNLWWATGYNIVAIPLAAGVLAFKGIILQPAVGAFLMSLSTVIVAVNAVALRRQKLD